MEKGVFTSTYQKAVAGLCRSSEKNCASRADPEQETLLSFVMPR